MPPKYNELGIHKRLARYCISGGTAFVIDLAILYALTEMFGWWYLWSSIAAFGVAIIVSFMLQKFWTFGDPTLRRAHHQFGMYIAVAIGNMGLNTWLMYTLVERFSIAYLFSQIAAAGMIAVSSFFIYRYLIFSRDNTPETLPHGTQGN